MSDPYKNNGQICIVKKGKRYFVLFSVYRVATIVKFSIYIILYTICQSFSVQVEKC